MRRDRLTLYFDGGCRPNPGAMEAAVVVRGETLVRRGLGHGDNAAAEWLALLFAVEVATARDAADVLLVGDSRSVIEQALGRWRCRSAHLQPHLDAFRAAAAAIPRLHLKHVPRSKNLAGTALERHPRG